LSIIEALARHRDIPSCVDTKDQELLAEVNHANHSGAIFSRGAGNEINLKGLAPDLSNVVSLTSVGAAQKAWMSLR